MVVLIYGVHVGSLLIRWILSINEYIIQSWLSKFGSVLINLPDLSYCTGNNPVAPTSHPRISLPFPFLFTFFGGSFRSLSTGAFCFSLCLPSQSFFSSLSLHTYSKHSGVLLSLIPVLRRQPFHDIPLPSPISRFFFCSTLATTKHDMTSP